MDYNDIVFDPLPLYLVKCLQHIQNAATSFVIGCYATTADAVKIGWLPVQERREWHLLKCLCNKILSKAFLIALQRSLKMTM